ISGQYRGVTSEKRLGCPQRCERLRRRAPFRGRRCCARRCYRPQGVGTEARKVLVSHRPVEGLARTCGSSLACFRFAALVDTGAVGEPLPLRDVPASLKELERCIEKLGAKGLLHFVTLSPYSSKGRPMISRLTLALLTVTLSPSHLVTLSSAEAVGP